MPEVGDNAVGVQVTDGGVSDTQSFVHRRKWMMSTKHQHPPSSPVLGYDQDQPYGYDVEATDQDVGDT